MKIPVIKPNVKDLDELRQQLVQMQDNINRALGQLSFDYTQAITLRVKPEEFPVLVKNQMPRPAFGLHTVYLRDLNDPYGVSAAISGPWPDWYPESGGIRIRSYGGLTPGHIYEIRLIAYA